MSLSRRPSKAITSAVVHPADVPLPCKNQPYINSGCGRKRRWRSIDNANVKWVQQRQKGVCKIDRGGGGKQERPTDAAWISRVAEKVATTMVIAETLSVKSGGKNG